MKKVIALVVIAAVLCALCACGEASLSEKDLSLTVSGVSADTGADVAVLLDAFGGDYAYSEAISCVYTGMDKTYEYPNCILYTYPDGDTDRLMELYCTADVTTSRGITIGSSRKDVEKAYGSGYTEAGITLTYALKAPDDLTLPVSIYFELQNDTVCAIGITSAHRAE